MTFDAQYWTERYQKGHTGWDTGGITPPLKEYFDQLTDRNLAILIPGAGNAYEAEYLFNKGFNNVTVLDLSAEPLQNLKRRVPAWPVSHLQQVDFFDHSGNYDLIVEQTFFCALHPVLRARYAKKMHDLLKTGGKLVGVLFNDPLNDDKPPFGGGINEYRSYFEPFFDFRVFDVCYNSILPRAGREIFINLQKKDPASLSSH